MRAGRLLAHAAATGTGGPPRLRIVGVAPAVRGSVRGAARRFGLGARRAQRAHEQKVEKYASARYSHTDGRRDPETAHAERRGESQPRKMQRIGETDRIATGQT